MRVVELNEFGAAFGLNADLACRLFAAEEAKDESSYDWLPNRWK
jgi:hypothetical protein